MFTLALSIAFAGDPAATTPVPTTPATPSVVVDPCAAPAADATAPATDASVPAVPTTPAPATTVTTPPANCPATTTTTTKKSLKKSNDNRMEANSTDE
jgi:hypothetical protein